MAGIDAFGTQLQRSDMAGSPVFTAIANVTNISSPELTRKTIDVSAHDSPEQWAEFLGGFKDGGEVGLELNYDPDEHDVFIGDLDDTVARDYRMVFPGGLGTWSFKAFIVKIGATAPMDDKLTGEHTYKVTGKPAIT